LIYPLLMYDDDVKETNDLRKYFKHILLVVAILMFLPACTMQYKYGDKTYQTSAEAIQAARLERANLETSTNPVSNPVGGRIKMVLPDRQRIRDVGVVTTGNVRPEAINYIVDILQTSYLSLSKIVRKSQIFDSVQVLEAYDTKHPEIGDYDFLVWLYLENADSAKWFIQHSAKDEQKHIEFSGNALNKMLWRDSFISAVQSAALDLAGGSRIVKKTQTVEAPNTTPVSVHKDDDNYSTTPVAVTFPISKAHPDDIAVIIGNANYTKRGKDIPDVTPAYADAEGIKGYVKQSLGISEDNIIYLKDATSAELEKVFGNERSYKGQLFRWLEPGKSRVFIYYSGHGAPGEKSGESYIVPSDAEAAYLELNGYPLKGLYQNLSKLPAKSVTVVLEACFSGASEAGTIVSNASPVYLKAKDTSIPSNITVIAAGAANQIASWEQDKSSGLFTKYFLKGMSGEADKDDDNKVSWSELKDYLGKTVSKYARRYYGREQSVQIVVGR